jgi:hypothetical protein
MWLFTVELHRKARIRIAFEYLQERLGGIRFSPCVGCIPALKSRSMSFRQDGLYILLLLALALPCFGQLIGPQITSISPSSVVATGPAFTLTVTGSGFEPGDAVVWKNSASDSATLATTYVSANQLTAQVAATRIVDVATKAISVYSTRNGNSNSADLTITPPVPRLTAIEPSVAAATGQQLDVAVYGTGLVNTSRVLVNGTPVLMGSDLYSYNPHLIAHVPPEVTSTPGVALISVVNEGLAAPSNSLELRLARPISISSLTPSSAVAGGDRFPMTISGSGFAPDAQVFWGSQPTGTPLASTFVSDSMLTAIVSAPLIATAGEVTVWVTSGGISTGRRFAITGVTPVISDVSPRSAEVEEPNFRVTAHGNGILTSSKLNWAGRAMTSYPVVAPEAGAISSIYADIPASLMTSIGPYSVTVTNPGGATSNSIDVMVNPRVLSYSPAAAAAGSPDVVVSVSGWRYSSGISAQLTNNSSTYPLVTTVVNAGLLHAVIPAALLTTPGHAVLQLRHSSGAQSRVVPFEILTAPSITSITPNSTEVSALPVTLSVRGSNFFVGCEVRWNGVSLQIGSQNTTQIDVTIPAALLASPVTADITVVCTGVTSNSLPFQVKPAAPFISPSSLFSSAGASGQQASIGGRNFNAGIVALWDGGQLPVRYVSATAIEVTLPPACFAVAGKYYVTLRNPDGGEAKLTLNVSPVLTSVTPAQARTGAPDQQITISGVGFSQRAEVVFRSVTLASTYIDSTRLTATIPATMLATAGSDYVFVRVDNISSNHASYVVSGGPPAIGRLMPNSAEAGSSASFSLTVGGNDFAQGAVVQFNGTAIPTTFGSLTSLQAFVPAALLATPGVFAVQVVNPDGSRSNSVDFTVLQKRPTLTNLSPASALPGRAISLSVTGSDFVNGISILWNGVSLQTEFRDPSLAIAAVPAELTMGAGEARVSAVNPGNPQVSNYLSFNISGAPVLTSLSPNTGEAGSRQVSFQIHGYGFGPASYVMFGETRIGLLSQTSTSLTAYVDRLSDTPGTVPVSVANGPSLVSNELTFTIVPQTPQVSALAPAWAPAGSADLPIHVLGSGFTPEASISFAGEPLVTSFISTTRLDAVVPARLLAVGGRHRVTAANPGGTPGWCDFLVDPVLTSISPGSIIALK